MDEKKQNKNRPRSKEVVTGTNKEVHNNGKISRRGTLGLIGGLPILMGALGIDSFANVKPVLPARILSDNDNKSFSYKPFSQKELKEFIDKHKKKNAKDWQSECIHVMNPDRMAFLGGHTCMSIDGPKTTTHMVE